VSPHNPFPRGRCAASRAAALLALAAITAAGAFVRADNLGARSFSVDEVLHVFAARSLNATGEPTLPSGERYGRALPVTRAVAALTSRFGEREAVARAPMVVAGVLAIPAVYLLGASLFGRVAGLLAACLLAFSPDGVAMSRFVRMYAPVQVLIIIATVLVWRGLRPADAARQGELPRRAAWLVAGGVLLFATARLHAEAYLVALPIALYVAAAAAGTALTRGLAAAARSLEGLLLAVGLAAGAIVLLVGPHLVTNPLAKGLSRLPWFPAEAWDPKFYHQYLADTYSYLWFLAPAATLAALVTRFRPALYASALFWVPFVCLSAIVPTQSERYIFSFLPFLFVLLGEGGRLAGGLLFERLVARLGQGSPWPRAAVPVAALLFAGTLLGVVRLSPWFAAAQANRLKTHGDFAGAAYAEWREAGRWLGERAGPDEAIVSTGDHLALYYLGRLDARLLYRNHAPHGDDRDVQQTAHGWRFRSYTSGAPAFSDADDLAALLSRHARGYLVVDRRRVDLYPSPFAPGVRALIAERMTPVSTPADASLAVFAWGSPRTAQAAGER
jgi:hypothetical protein